MIFLMDKVVPKITPLRPVDQYKVKKTELAKSKDGTTKRIKQAIVLGLNSTIEIDVL